MFKKALAATVIVWVIATRVGAHSPLPPKCVYDSQEVLWFSVNFSNLITVSGNGRVGVWDFSSGAMRDQFSLPTNELTYPGGNLAVSRNQQIALATVTDAATLLDDKFFSTLTGYGTSGKRGKDFKIELVSPGSCGFVGTTSTIILADRPPNNAVVAAVDAVTGNTLWRSETDDDVQTGTIAVADGQYYVNFCRDRHLRARNQSGKLVWDRPVPKGKFAEPGYWPDTPVLPYVVVYESDEKKDNVADLVALSAKDGKTVWRKKNAQFRSLKAVSEDGMHQAFFQQGRVELAALSKQAKSQVVALHYDVDAAFSPDGRFLLCLPALVTVSENKIGNLYTVARHSRLLSVVDVETGKMVKQFSLATPLEKN